MIKISDIAKETGYSVTTVSKALNGYTDISQKAKIKIQEKATEMGYYPNANARSLVTKRSYVIGVIMDEILGLGMEHPFFAGVVQNFRNVLDEEGYDTMFISGRLGNSNIHSYIDHCKQRGVDGVFILCSDIVDEDIQKLIKSQIPTVLFDMPEQDCHTVYSDHYAGGVAAMEYLIELGHKKIAHIYGTEITAAGRMRKQAYLDIMKKYHYPVHEGYLQSGGYFDYKYGKKAMMSLLDLHEQPTAVFVAGDVMALGAVNACYERHVRIPDDISIIGFDNIKMLDWVTPSLTTVAQDMVELGRGCAQVLLDLISDKPVKNQKRVIQTYLVERGSCQKRS